MAILEAKNGSLQLQIDMLEAARMGREDIVARLLALDPSLVDVSRDRQTPLHWAARNGHDGVVAQLLALSPQASNVRDHEGRTALHLAAKNGHDTIVARLLAHNPALIDAVTPHDNMTALHLAVCEAHESTVRQLLSHSPGLIDLKIKYDQTAVHIAAGRGYVKVLAQLLALSPQSSDARDCRGRTALHFAAENGYDKTVAQLLVHNPALIDALAYATDLLSDSGFLELNGGNTALHLAASRGHVKVVAELLARRPSSLADEDGRTPLFCAANKGHQEVVDMFPLTTDQVHRRDKYGNTLLHFIIGGERPFKPAFIQRVWEMNPDALFVANTHGCMPFDCAISSANDWAIEYFQCKLSIFSVEEALSKEMQRCLHAIEEEESTIEEVKVLERREQRFREVVQGECERPLLLSLPRDCVRLISDYVQRLPLSLCSKKRPFEAD